MCLPHRAPEHRCWNCASGNQDASRACIQCFAAQSLHIFKQISLHRHGFPQLGILAHRSQVFGLPHTGSALPTSAPSSERTPGKREARTDGCSLGCRLNQGVSFAVASSRVRALRTSGLKLSRRQSAKPTAQIKDTGSSQRPEASAICFPPRTSGP